MCLNLTKAAQISLLKVRIIPGIIQNHQIRPKHLTINRVKGKCKQVNITDSFSSSWCCSIREELEWMTKTHLRWARVRSKNLYFRCKTCKTYRIYKTICKVKNSNWSSRFKSHKNNQITERRKAWWSITASKIVSKTKKIKLWKSTSKIQSLYNNSSIRQTHLGACISLIRVEQLQT